MPLQQNQFNPADNLDMVHQPQITQDIIQSLDSSDFFSNKTDGKQSQQQQHSQQQQLGASQSSSSSTQEQMSESQSLTGAKPQGQDIQQRIAQLSLQISRRPTTSSNTAACGGHSQPITNSIFTLSEIYNPPMHHPTTKRRTLKDHNHTTIATMNQRILPQIELVQLQSPTYDQILDRVRKERAVAIRNPPWHAQEHQNKKKMQYQNQLSLPKHLSDLSTSCRFSYRRCSCTAVTPMPTKTITLATPTSKNQTYFSPSESPQRNLYNKEYECQLAFYQNSQIAMRQVATGVDYY